MMLYILFALGLGAAQPLLAQDRPDAGIQATIQNQITAFQSHDLDKAFSFASPSIKAIFATPQNFGAMVQRGYPMVYHPQSVRMLGLRQVGGQQWQRLMITDQAGTIHLLEYELIQSSEGWQIYAVQILPQSGLGA